MSGFETERVRHPEIDSLSEKGTIRVQEDTPCTIRVQLDDKLFVAVGKDFKANKSILIWALHNSKGKIWILHVHTPAKLIPIFGGKFAASQVGKQEVMAYHEKERNETHQSLDEYIQLCAKSGRSAEKLVFEADSIEAGLVTVVSQKRIGRLVMGAAADNRYKKNMTELKSKKAMYVRLQAPVFCQIDFVCKGNLVNKRIREKPKNPNNGSGESNSLRSWSVTAASGSKTHIDIDRYKSRSVGVGGIIRVTDECPTQSTNNGSFDESEHLVRVNMSGSAPPPTSYEPVRSSASFRPSNIYQRRNGDTSRMSPLDERCVGSSYSPHFLEVNMNDELCDQQLMADAHSSKEEAYLESMKRRKAEMETFEAIRKAKAMEYLYYEEQKQRKELEEKLAKVKEELETTRNQNTKALEELQTALYWKYKLERDELEVERDNALAETERVRRQQALLDPTGTQNSRFFVDFTHSEIAEATDNFNLSRKIGEGGFGKTYKGLLRHTEVAIKVLDPNSVQGPQEFIQEVDALSKLRHPNIVTLMGVCSEASGIVYEYLPNGSLEDRLACKDNTPPLPWKTRIQIAVELCSVLMFLHSSQPESIVHGDLKPANVLLDAHFSCKLSDFGICRTISNDETSTRFYLTSPKGTFAYMDPEFVSMGELTPKSDVYSFGVLLLRLLTGKSAFGVAREVRNAMDKGSLGALLDPLSGDWPLAQVKELSLLALGCCEVTRKSRPDIADVWKVLEPMKVPCERC